MKFNKIKIGDKAEVHHKITEKDINKFINLTGDKNKIHYDKKYANKTYLKKPVAHGMLGASFISTLIGTKLPGDGAIWFSQNLDFLRPVRVNDKIKVKAKVIYKNITNQILKLSIIVENQFKQSVISGEISVKATDKNYHKERFKIEKEKKIKKKRKFSFLKSKKQFALVLGSTGGIGEATCIQLAKDGYNIILHYNKNKSKVKKIQNKIKRYKRSSVIIQSNLFSEKSLKKMFLILDSKKIFISTFINCASIDVPNIKFENQIWANFEKHYNLNIKSNLFIIKKLLPNMKKFNNGKIVLISTQYTEDSKRELSYYITSKSALEGFAKSFAKEYAHLGIRVNIVSPGMTDTNLISNISIKDRMLIAATTPMKRLTYPEDVANAISFLVSEKSKFMTGTTLRVNGGQIML